MKPLGIQATTSSILMSGTVFLGALVTKTFLRPPFLCRWLKKVFQILVKECALSSGKLPSEGLTRNNWVTCRARYELSCV